MQFGKQRRVRKGRRREEARGGDGNQGGKAKKQLEEEGKFHGRF